MKLKFNLKYFLLLVLATFALSCTRPDDEEDVLSQEDISNIILIVRDDSTGNSATYNYTLNSATNPVVKLSEGKTYTVNTVFLNGNDDETESIIEAKDEHFLVFNFQDADIRLERTDDASSTRSDGARVGLKTKWIVAKAAKSPNAQLIITLIHDASSVSEAQNGSVFGSVQGGETDAMATFTLANF